MEVQNPEELMKVLLDNPSARSQLNSFVEQAIAKIHSPAPSKVVPLDIIRDAFEFEFKDQINPGEVPWSDVQDSVRTEMVEYVREMMSSSGVSLPTRSIIGKRIKRYYRSQRHQAQIKADKEKRRRQRFLNKRNRLTMEKRDREVRNALEREELSNEEIKELRSTIPPVEAKEVVVYDSGDEDALSDLLMKRKISLERGRKTARENQRRGSRLLALLSGNKAPSQQMSVKDLMELAKENVPVPAAKAPSASLTPLRCCTTSTADAALRAQQKRGRLALTRKPQTSIGKLSLGPSSERSNLMVAAGALRSSLVETEDSLSMVVDSPPFLFQGDFTD